MPMPSLKPLHPAVMLLAGALCAAAPAAAQQVATPTETKAVDAKAFKLDDSGPYANADLSYVLTSGNSRSSSLGFKGDVTQRWTRHSVAFAAGGIRASSTATDARFAVGTPGDFEVQLPDSERTAEGYYARGRYDYKLTDRLFFTGGAGWERNRFSGIDDRWLVDAGVGYIFVANDKTDFRGMAGLTYTDEQYTAGPPDSDSFVGARRVGLAPPALPDHDAPPHSDRGREPRGHGRPPRRRDGRAAGRDVEEARAEGELAAALRQPAGARRVPLFTPGGIATGLNVLAPYGDGPGLQRLARALDRAAEEVVAAAIARAGAPVRCGPGRQRLFFLRRSQRTPSPWSRTSQGAPTAAATIPVRPAGLRRPLAPKGFSPTR